MSLSAYKRVVSNDPTNAFASSNSYIKSELLSIIYSAWDFTLAKPFNGNPIVTFFSNSRL